MGGRALLPAASAALGYLDVRVVDTDYSSFAVVYIYKELEGALSTLVQLYSEGPMPPAPAGPPAPRDLPHPGTRSQVWAHTTSQGGWRNRTALRKDRGCGGASER